MFKKLGEKLFGKTMLLIGGAAVLEFSYLAALGAATNPETGAYNLAVAENLEFWGPILECLIGVPYLLALVLAFVESLSTRDISSLVLVIFLVPTLSLAISIVAPHFAMAVVVDTVTFAMGVGVAAEGASAASVAMALGGPTAAATVGAYFGVLQALLAVVLALFGSLFSLSRMS